MYFQRATPGCASPSQRNKPTKWKTYRDQGIQHREEKGEFLY